MISLDDQIIFMKEEIEYSTKAWQEMLAQGKVTQSMYDKQIRTLFAILETIETLRQKFTNKQYEPMFLLHRDAMITRYKDGKLVTLNNNPPLFIKMIHLLEEQEAVIH